MKRKIILTVIVAGIAMILTASIVLPAYDKSKPPGLALPAAYNLAITALGSDTNLFHCVSAEITTWFSPQGEWYFKFYSTNSNMMPKLIAVEFDGKVIFDNGAR